MKIHFFVGFLFLILTNCTAAEEQQAVVQISKPAPLYTGAARTEVYLPLLKGKRVGLVANHSSLIGKTHLLDSLLSRGVNVAKVFGPEHGFRGQASDGAHIDSEVDAKTGIPILSLYGLTKKGRAEDFTDLDILIFDIQDVGVRFYTYISTMHHVMRICAENDIPFLVLDRPNPNGHFIDGPVLDPAYSSFVGMHPIPLVHGLTVGELAQMINGEGWLQTSRPCPLTVISCENYTHDTPYELPVKPSPNLPNMRAVYLYPSLGLFEGTVVNCGRGTDKQFQLFGAPNFPKGEYHYTPESKPGAVSPKHMGVACHGYDLSGLETDKLQQHTTLQLHWLLNFYNNYPDKPGFFLKNGFFDKLAGGPRLREQIISGWNEAQIRASWKTELETYKKMRQGYLLYP